MATQLKKTVKPSGGDYTSLEACMNANEQDLVANDLYFDVEIDGDWSGGADTTAVTIENYTTDATRYINIYTTSAARHKGVFSTDYYYLNQAGYLITTLNCTDNYVTINGLQVRNGGGSYRSAIALNGSDTTVKNCLIPFSDARGIDGQVSYANRKIYNNIIYDTDEAGIFLYIVSGTNYVYNNTVYGATDTGIVKSTSVGAVVLKNNICYNNTTDYSGTFGLASTHNLSKDDTAPALNTYYRNKTLTFTNTGAGTEDFHLDSGDSDAIDKGTDLSGEFFSDDIDGDTRTGDWELGADDGYTLSTVATGIMTPRSNYWGDL